jgi:hypothetical protein
VTLRLPRRVVRWWLETFIPGSWPFELIKKDVWCLGNHTFAMDPHSPVPSSVSTSSVDEAADAVTRFLDVAVVARSSEEPPVVPPRSDSPPPPVPRSTAEMPEASSYEWKLRAMVEMERRTRMARDVDPVHFFCNVPGVNLASDLYDCQGDSEWTQGVLAYLRTKYLLSIGIKPEAWMIPRVMYKRVDGSWR